MKPPRPPRPRKAKSGADTSSTVGPTGEPLIKKGGKINPAAIYRAVKAETPAAPASTPAPPPLAEALEDVDGDDDEVLQTAGEGEGQGEATNDPGSARRADPPGQPVTFVLQRDLVKRLDKYLTDRITFMSRSKLQQLIESGGVTVNGRTAKSSTVLREGDTVVVAVPAPPTEDFEPQDIALDVLFEDEHLIVLNKQADIIVHPARTHTHGTLINALAFHFRNRSTTGGGLSGVGKEFARPGVVHRLDRHTTGLIVFAKSDQAHWQLANQFMRRTVDKRYVAVVHGAVEPRVDVIDLPLGPHPSRERGYREKQVVRHDHLGKPAVTIYRVLGVYGPSGEPPAPVQTPPAAKSKPRGWTPTNAATTPARRAAPTAADRCSLVEVELKTGRTHQIRVHFSHLGWPLVGDDLYGGRPMTLPEGGVFARQALHAAALSFRHPISNQPMAFTAPLPADLAGLIRWLRRGGAEEPPTPPGALLGLGGVEKLVG